MNSFYDHNPSKEKVSSFYLDYIAGTNFIIFVVHDKNSFEEFKMFWITIPDNIQKVLLVYNLERFSKLKNKMIQSFINENNSGDKFVTSKVVKVHLPVNDADTKEAIKSERYYLPHKFIGKSEVLLNLDDLWYAKAIHTIRHNTIFAFMSRVIIEKDYSLARELEENKQDIYLDSLFKLEKLLKSNELKDIDYKIATLNRILQIIVKNLKEGIKLCSLMDAKYYWNFSNVIKKWVAHIPLVNELIQKKSLFDIKYFGKAPPDSTMTISNNKLVTRYYNNYFKKLANELIDFIEPSQFLQDIQIKVSNHWNSISENEQSVPFFIVTRLIEAVMKNKGIFCIYFQQDSGIENLSKLIKEFDPSLVMNNAKINGMFDLLSRCEKWREDFKYCYRPLTDYGPDKLRRRELKGIRETQQKEAEAKKAKEKMLKRSETIKIEQVNKMSNKRMHEELVIDEIEIDLSKISSDSDEEPEPDENVYKSIKNEINEIYTFIDKYNSSYL